MRHRKKRVLEFRWIRLNSVTSPITGRKHYEVSVNAIEINQKVWSGEITDIRRHFDPFGNRGAKFGTKWKYSNKKVAEQLVVMALLKWGE
jgi:hypothetical protein